MPTKTRVITDTKVTTIAPLLPVALATQQYHAAALCIVCTALDAIAEQERSDAKASPQA